MIKEKKWSYTLIEEESDEIKIRSLDTSFNGKFVLLGLESKIVILDMENGKKLNEIKTVHKNGIGRI